MTDRATAKCPFSQTPQGKFEDATISGRDFAVIERTPDEQRHSHPLMIGQSTIGNVARVVGDLLQHGYDWLTRSTTPADNASPARPIWYSPAAAMQALNFSSDPRSVFHWIHENYGPVARLTAPNGQNFLFISDTDAIEQVLKTTDGGRIDNFDKSELLSDGLQSFSPGNRDTLLTASDQVWKSRHKVVQPAFSRGNFEAPEMALEISSIVHSSFDELAAGLAPEGSSIDLQDEMSLVALRVAMSTVLGFTDTSRQELEQVRDAFRSVFSAFPLEAVTPGSFPFAPLGMFSSASAEISESISFLHQYADHLLDAIEQQPINPKNPLQLMMRVKAADSGASLSRETLKGELLTILFASHETSGNVLAWTLGKMAENPAIGENVLAEAKAAEVTGSEGLSEKIKLMPYTYQVIQEGLRMFPPLYALLRRATNDSTIETSSGKLLIPAGTEVILNIYDSQRDESRWGSGVGKPPASQLVPERWSEDPTNTEGKTLPRLSTFGGGPRICVGANLAMTEFLTILPEFIKRFTYQPEFSEVETGMTSDGTLQRKGGFPATLLNRRAR